MVYISVSHEQAYLDLVKNASPESKIILQSMQQVSEKISKSNFLDLRLEAVMNSPIHTFIQPQSFLLSEKALYKVHFSQVLNRLEIRGRSYRTLSNYWTYNQNLLNILNQYKNEINSNLNIDYRCEVKEPKKRNDGSDPTTTSYWLSFIKNEHHRSRKSSSRKQTLVNSL